MSQLRLQSLLWHGISAIWALIAIARWLEGVDGTDAMVQFGVAFTLGNIFSLRLEMQEMRKDHHNIRIVCYNNSIEKGVDMATANKQQDPENWVVEVRRAHALEHRPGQWCCIAQCGDGQTAIAVADAVQNFMRTGLIGGDFHTRTRLVTDTGGAAHDV